MEIMGIIRILVLFFTFEIVVGNNNNNNNTSSFEFITNNNSSERSPKVLLSPYRRVVSSTYNKPVSNVNPNFSTLRNSVRSDINNPYKNYETTLNHHATRTAPLVLNVDPYHPYIQRDGLKNIYAPQKQYYGNVFDASGFKIVSDNPMTPYLYKKPAIGGGYPKLFTPSLNYFNSASISQPVTLKSEPETANFSSYNNYFNNFNNNNNNNNNNNDKLTAVNNLSDQYPKIYPDTKSYLVSPTFSPGLISPGGFKPINSPQLHNNPQVSEHVRVFNTEPKTIYSTSFNNPGIIASGENFRAHSATFNAPNRSYPNPKKRINGIYQPLSAQPQLLFHGAVTPESVYHSQPIDRIRTDVEVINKPKAPVSDDANNNEDDDESSEDGFKIFHPNSFDSESHEENPSASSAIKANEHKDFSAPFFSSYDKSFGKFSSKITPEQPNSSSTKSVEKPEKYGSTSTYESQPVKHVYENHGPEDYSSSHESYEFQDGSENHYKKTSKNKKSDDEEEDGDEDHYRSDESLPHHASYRHDFTHEFVDGYKRNIPSNDYSHIKEVPDIDESDYKSKIVSVSIKGQPIKQPTYVYTSTKSTNDDPESSNEDEKTVQLMSRTPFGHKISRQKSRSNNSHQSSETRPKQINEPVKKGRSPSRGSKKQTRRTEN